MRNQTGLERHNRIVVVEIVNSYDIMRPEYPDDLFEMLLSLPIPKKAKTQLR
jgi:hypothetical protein